VFAHRELDVLVLLAFLGRERASRGDLSQAGPPELAEVRGACVLGVAQLVQC
jgi:hypothetical protein